MPYADGKLALSESQQVNADADSTKYLDFELTDPGLTDGRPWGVVILVKTKATAGTGIIFNLVHKTSEPTDNDADMVTARILAASLVVGARITIAWPRGVACLRYMRLYFDIIAGTEDYTLSVYVTPLPA